MKWLLQNLIIVLLFIASTEIIYSQDGPLQIVVSPLIGDTLSLEERNYYKLFPKVEGFQWAVFYLNPDSSLSAKVTYMEDDVYKDLLVKRYRTLDSFQKYLTGF